MEIATIRLLLLVNRLLGGVGCEGACKNGSADANSLRLFVCHLGGRELVMCPSKKFSNSSPSPSMKMILTTSSEKVFQFQASTQRRPTPSLNRPSLPFIRLRVESSSTTITSLYSLMLSVLAARCAGSLMTWLVVVSKSGYHFALAKMSWTSIHHIQNFSLLPPKSGIQRGFVSLMTMIVWVVPLLELLPVPPVGPVPTPVPIPILPVPDAGVLLGVAPVTGVVPDVNVGAAIEGCGVVGSGIFPCVNAVGVPPVGVDV
eukprot:10361561-Ditylum_brightwellii.AAC.1